MILLLALVVYILELQSCHFSVVHYKFFHSTSSIDHVSKVKGLLFV